MSFPAAMLVGATVASTDAAAVFAILRGQKASINPNLQSLLEYESGSNDPAAFLLTTVMISIVSAQGGANFSFVKTSWDILWGIVWGLGMGAALGIVVGMFGQIFYKWIQNFLEYNGLRLVVAIAIVLLCYGFANAIFHANSLMTCYVAGITMGNMQFHFKETFIKFHDGLSWLMQILLFTILGSFFDYHMLFNDLNMVSAIFISLVLMFVARPIAVLLCMIRSPFTFRERLFTSWVGIRGSAPIMLCALVLASAGEDVERYPRAQGLFYAIFTVVLFSILFQGSTIMWVAKKLKLLLPYKENEDPGLHYETADDRKIFRFTVDENSVLDGKKLGFSGLESNAILLVVKRGEKLLQPHPDLILKAGDMLSVLARYEEIEGIQHEFFPNQKLHNMLTIQQVLERLSSRYNERRHKKIAE